MLITPGDLIPVQPEATTIPWTRRKSQILNFLHRGPVTFSTLVYDTNVGDISALSTYFNPERVSVKDLNSRFGQFPSSGENSREDNVKVGSENVLKPRLLLYPEHNLNQTQVKVQRTLKWVLSHQEGEEGDLSRPPSADQPVNRLPVTEGPNDVFLTRPTTTEPPSAFRPTTEQNKMGSTETQRAARPTSRFLPEFNYSARNVDLHTSQGSLRASRAGSVSSQSSRLTPIGEPLKDLNQEQDFPWRPVRNDTYLRPNTMPNLESALDSVWREHGEELDRQFWGVGWRATETTW